MEDYVNALPEKTLFAQVDTFWAVKDYPPLRNCVRFIGVDTYSFDNALFNLESGCQTYILDMDWRDMGWQFPSRWAWDACGSELDVDGSDGTWWRIDYETSSGITNSYAYPAFEGADPTFIRILGLRNAEGEQVAPVAEAATPLASFTIAEGVSSQLTAFHVGQGMCSVLHAPSGGYVLDAGAGTPVSRKDYLALAHDDGTPFLNELRPLVGGLAKVSAILSHPDADHWRLLDWDVGLLTRLQHICLPAGQPALAFSAPKVKPRVVGLDDQTFTLNSRNWLDVRRSRPKRSDKNGECLVAVAHCEGRHGLLAGDYVYERMARDASHSIVGMAGDLYDAVVVPHHGDEASASSVARPRQPLQSKAFFSAGTHAGYGHPTPASILSHMREGYVVIDQHECRDVIGRRLLP
jgi:beta-lactamase superfamily II metal-dependent hydrolase